MAQNSTVLIGAQTTVNGQITGDDGITVEGNVEGGITLSNQLIIEESGQVVADISVTRLTVRGVLSGNVVASESVTIESGARVVGDIRTPRLAIEDGAAFRGAIEMDVAMPDDISE